MRLRSLLFLLILILSFSLFSAGVIYPAKDSFDMDNQQDRIKQIETDLSHEKEQYLEFDQKEKGLLDQLSDIEKDVNEKKILLRDINADIQATQAEVNKQKDMLGSIEASYLKMKKLLDKRLAAFYKYAKRGYLRIFANTNDLAQLSHMVKYLRVMLDKDLEIMRKTSGEYRTYRDQVSIIEKKLKTISDMKEEEGKNLVSLKAELEKKVILLSRVHQEKEFYETAVKELGSATENLKNTILRLDSVENKKEDIITPLPTGFAQQKGKLPLPVKGKILKRDAKSGDNIFNALKGVYISGSFGEDVKAVFPGRVDYSGQIKGYGQVVVINHGERYFTISAYLSGKDKAEGEMVKQGEIIGQVGETGLLEGAALYFEMRNGDSNIDPLRWLKVN